MPRNRRRSRAAVDHRVATSPVIEQPEPTEDPAPEALRQTDPVQTVELSEAPAPDVGLASIGVDTRWGRAGLPFALVLLATIAGLVLRFADLTGVPPGFHQDEAGPAIDAYSLIHTARDHLGHPLNLLGFEGFGDWPPAVSVLLAIPAIAIFGVSEWSARASTAFYGVLLIPLIYALAWRLFDRKAIGVAAAWVVAILPWHVHQSRFAIQPSIVPTLVTVIMLCLITTVRRPSDRAALATAIAFATGIAAYHSLRIQLPLMVGAGVLVFWRQLIRIRPTIIAISGVIVAIVAIPSAIFIIGDEAGGARARQVSVFTDNSIYLPPGTKVDARFVAGQYLDYFSWDFLFKKADGIAQLMLPNRGVLPISLLPLLLIGIGALIWSVARPITPWHRQRAIFLLLAVVVYPIPGFLTLPSPHNARALHSIPLVALLSAVGAVTLGEVIVRLFRRTPIGTSVATIPVVVALALGAYGVDAGGQLRQYFRDYPKYGPEMVVMHYGLEDAVAYAIDHRTEYDEIWITNTNQPYIYVLFYGDWEPNDYQGGLVVRRNPPFFNSVIAFQNFRFPAGIRGGPPDDIQPANLTRIFTTTYPGGQIAYDVREGNVPDRGKVLLIYRP